jgi:hyperosmotically inducible periplasmic protein
MADISPDKKTEVHVRTEHAPPSRPGGHDGVHQPIRPTTPVDPPADVPTDEALAEGIRDALAADGRIRSDDLAVTVAEGVVGLDGTVDLEFQRTLATALVQTVPGVLNVNNRLTVRPD